MPRIRNSHLTYGERCQIYALLKRGDSRRAIARSLEVAASTITRELKRNIGGGGYRFKQAHKFSLKRRKSASQIPCKMTPKVNGLVHKMLIETQSSPQQISGRLLKENGIHISHESIYRLIWKDKRSGGELYLHLRHRAKKYNNRGAKSSGRGLIPNRVDIDERPKIVEEKTRFGDFELDTIVGKDHRGAIVSIVDRASKFTYLRLLKRGTAQAVKKALIEALSMFSAHRLVKTLTSDNGKEFAEHVCVSQETGGDFYFAKPYHSWERGLNEHTNGLVRQYFPKGTDFTILTHEEVAEVENTLNNRPRKILNFETPKERIFSLLGNLQSVALQG